MRRIEHRYPYATATMIFFSFIVTGSYFLMTYEIFFDVGCGAEEHESNEGRFRTFEPLENNAVASSGTVNTLAQGVTLATETVPVLYPHDHTDGGTVFEHSEAIRSDVWIVQKDVLVTVASYQVHNAPQSIIHHVALSDLNCIETISSCSPQLYYNHSTLVQGSDAFLFGTNGSLPEDVIFVEAGTPLVLEAALHNPLPPYGPGEIYSNVSVSLNLKLREAPDNYTAPQKFFLILGEDSFTFRVPARTLLFTLSGEHQANAYHTFEQAGTISIMGAHLHPLEGGKNVKVYLNDELVHTFIPIQDEQDPWLWTTPLFDRPLAVNQGDTLYITATYSNGSGQDWRGAMGIVGIIFKPLKVS